MDYKVHGILQARILDWVAFPFSRGFSQPRDQTQVFCIAGRFFTSWATREALDKPRQSIRKERHHFANKSACSQSYGFSSSHAKMWELVHKEGWVQKNWCFQIVVLKTWENFAEDSKEIKQVNPKGNQPWMFHYFQQWKPIFIGMTVAEVEAPILSPLDAKSWLTGKDPDAGQDWGQEERRQQRMRQWDGITDSMDVNLNKLQETVKDWCAIVHGVIKSWTQLSNWKTTTTMPNYVNIPSCAYILPLYLQKWSVCINHLSI